MNASEFDLAEPFETDGQLKEITPDLAFALGVEWALFMTMTLFSIASACLGNAWPLAVWATGTAIGTLLKNPEAGFWIAVLLTPTLSFLFL